MSELAAVERICDIADAHISERGYMAYWDTESRKQHEDEFGKRMGTVRSRFSEDYLILSEEFLSTFTEFESALRVDEYNSSPDEEYDAFSNAVRSFRPRLVSIGRAEMKAQSDWRRLFPKLF